jgi:hypothetical protein
VRYLFLFYKIQELLDGDVQTPVGDQSSLGNRVLVRMPEGNTSVVVVIIRKIETGKQFDRV